MNKTNVPKNPKLPLSSTSRKAFERRYQELFLREAEEGVSDEKLMKAVNDYESKQNPNPESKEQEGIQDQVGNVSDGKGTEEGNENVTFTLNRDIYKSMTGKDADESWDNDKVVEEIENFRYDETRKSASNKYFDLFGSKPIESMTNEQIINAVETKEKEIAKAKEAKKEDKTADVSLEAGQVLAKHKVTNESRVFNANTLKYLNDWEETPIAPRELKK